MTPPPSELFQNFIHFGCVRHPLFPKILLNFTSLHSFITTVCVFQVVKFAVYSYFAVALFSEQEVTNIPHIGFPIFLILKFIFFFGWLEVAKAIDDPWDGNDHEDFKASKLTR